MYRTFSILSAFIATPASSFLSYPALAPPLSVAAFFANFCIPLYFLTRPRALSIYRCIFSILSFFISYSALAPSLAIAAFLALFAILYSVCLITRSLLFFTLTRITDQ